MPILLRIVGSAALALLLGGGWLFLQKPTPAPAPLVAEEVAPDPRVAVIGESYEKRKIESFTFGTGNSHIVFVGGVHGGYEWNSVLLAHQVADYLTQNPEAVSKSLTVTIIPNLNPDGVYKVIGKEGRFSAADVPQSDHSAGRFNAQGVDLNRNFDCKWQPEATWKGKKVSAGSAPFSEPETLALKTFLEKSSPDAVIFWHSQANAVYASECERGILPETLQVMNTYAEAAGYKSVQSFDAYPVTGDAEGWLASIGIPAITVELSSHESIDWEKNLKGVQAVLKQFSSR
ncbi:MAG: hypothetical protein RIQ56_185 [Candidatus Parcubacteria bacterium]|jgi:predicted deacylase